MQSFKLIYKAGKFELMTMEDLWLVCVLILMVVNYNNMTLKLKVTLLLKIQKIPIELKIEIRRSIRPLQKNLYIICKKFLKENDKIIIRIGDRRFGSPGVRLQTFCEKKFDFKILVDPFATQDFIPLPDGRHPEISIVPTIGKN